MSVDLSDPIGPMPGIRAWGNFGTAFNPAQKRAFFWFLFMAVSCGLGLGLYYSFATAPTHFKVVDDTILQNHTTWKLVLADVAVLQAYTLSQVIRVELFGYVILLALGSRLLFALAVAFGYVPKGATYKVVFATTATLVIATFMALMAFFSLEQASVVVSGGTTKIDMSVHAEQSTRNLIGLLVVVFSQLPVDLWGYNAVQRVKNA